MDDPSFLLRYLTMYLRLYICIVDSALCIPYSIQAARPTRPHPVSYTPARFASPRGLAGTPEGKPGGTERILRSRELALWWD